MEGLLFDPSSPGCFEDSFVGTAPFADQIDDLFSTLIPWSPEWQSTSDCSQEAIFQVDGIPTKERLTGMTASLVQRPDEAGSDLSLTSLKGELSETTNPYNAFSSSSEIEIIQGETFFTEAECTRVAKLTKAQQALASHGKKHNLSSGNLGASKADLKMDVLFICAATSLMYYSYAPLPQPPTQDPVRYTATAVALDK
ncbi:hypothetical protein CEUSTIGMA_g3609.t1 [Chlamydomonas eustigma]|uniref:Uncharacterized protein n=1 Tax=Chlamydomonas eustigma TaxID=1157962 RepID=A0A250WZF5_9CHLO|nr:hypothetical protein CEUSTIGMA_g3609.t1 [Chlamydomonas eustigma]|eukprot:GAX76165.1 hypothetical protein CEUSTIGMA_g3609.t1 [Chlamydomonas eustigma]